MSGQPPARAEHAGSLVRPVALAGAAHGHAALRDAVSLQERLGLQVVTDGHLRRTTWNYDVHAVIENVELVAGTDGGPSRLDITGPLARRVPLVADDYSCTAAVASTTVKATLPAPGYLHGRGRSVVVRTRHYQSREQLFDDIALVYRAELADLYARGCRYVQLDDPNFAFLTDPRFRTLAHDDTGEDPDELLAAYAAVISAVTAGRPADLRISLNVSRGTIAGRPVARACYPAAADALSAADVDGYLLDLDQGVVGGLDFLTLLPAERFVVLGLVNARTGTPDDLDAIHDRVREASARVALERLALGTQCGFADVPDPSTVTASEQQAALRRLVTLSHQIWGAEPPEVLHPPAPDRREYR